MAHNVLSIKGRSSVNDLASIDPNTYSIAGDSAAAMSLFGVNGTLKAGIATETEVGLSNDRFILVPVLHQGNPVNEAAFDIAHICSLSDDGQGLTRVVGPVPANNSLHMGAVTNGQVRRAYEDRQNQLALMAQRVVDDNDILTRNAARALARAAAPGAQTPEQALLAAEADEVPLGPLAYISDPNINFAPIPPRAYEAAHLPAWTALCYELNRRQFTEDYDIANNQSLRPMVSTAAHMTAMAFNKGLLEPGASREWIPVHVTTVDNINFTVAAIGAKYQDRPLNNRIIAVNNVINVANVGLDAKILEVSLGSDIAAGFNHYGLNHSTGGSQLNGTVAVALAINNLYQYGISNTAARAVVRRAGCATLEEQTSVYYNALHPINKRLVAMTNIGGSNVYSAHYCPSLPIPKRVPVDSFIALRTKMSPAGSHKAAVADVVLRKILNEGSAMMLPWYNQLQNVVDLIIRLKHAGAEVHPGARYYTDTRAPISQSELDEFIPDLAAFVQIKMRNSTLANSPHMSATNSGMADARWAAYLTKTVTTHVTSITDIRMGQIGAITGATQMAVDLNDDVSVAQSANAQRALAALLYNS